MITRVRLVRFKRFLDHKFDLSGSSVILAGPNNSGKTTLLHAISAWNLALKRWLAERGDSGGKKRISVVLDEFTALPLREMNLLWLNRHTARRAQGAPKTVPPKPAPIFVEVVSDKGMRVQESLTMEILYANEKLIYCRPVKSPDQPEPIDEIPAFAKKLEVVHVPAFSGIGTQEPRHTIGIQNKLVGEGRPGEIVRNLLFEIWEKSDKKAGRGPWKDLAADMHRLFQCDLLAPEFSDARPYILCEYRPRPNPADPSSKPPKFDIANAGSGFHQVLLLLSFFYGRPASVLLLDEPDAHLHFILQSEIFDHLRSIAQRRECKLIIATHAEVLLAGSEPEQIISFVGQEPRRLVKPEEKNRLQEALKRLTSLDLLQADQAKAILYVEDESDQKILREWAHILQHRSEEFLKFPYVYPLKGKGNLDDAKTHFQCLRLANPSIRGICILDRDVGEASSPKMPEGLTLRYWGRYEIENYLLVPSVLKRFISDPERPLLNNAADGQIIDQEFAANFPANVDFLKDLPALRDLKASEFLVGLLNKTSFPLPKRELFMLAEAMEPQEIHPDVGKMLDDLASILPGMMPSAEANVAPLDVNGVENGGQGDAASEEAE